MSRKCRQVLLKAIRDHVDEANQGVEHWKKFFADSEKYPHVGKVIHKPIDPRSPVPEHCEEEKRVKKAGYGPKQKKEL